MSILPQFDVNLDTVINQSIQEAVNTVPKEYAWDFENNDFRLIDGKFIIVEGKEALKVWIWKALHTVKMKYSIYSDSYGHDLDSIVGQGVSNELLQSEAKRLVWECLQNNHHITGIENFSAIRDSDTLSISFTAITDQGEVSVSV